MPRTRHVLVLAVENCQSLDVFGPVEVFDHASRVKPGAYRVQVVGPAQNGTILLSSGIRLCTAPLPDPPPRHDTLVIAGGDGAVAAVDDDQIVDWVARAARRARRTASVCTGAFLLARAGLLDDHRATTHWAYCDKLAHGYERVTVEPDPVFIHDGDVWTSAGITAGIDLSLALVEDDLGPAVALAVPAHSLSSSNVPAANPNSAEPSSPNRQRDQRCENSRPGSPLTSRTTSRSHDSPIKR